MLNSMTLLFPGLAFHPALADEDKKDSITQKTEIELHLGLNEDGFNRLLRRWQKKSSASKRIDHYFDIFRSGAFLIHHIEPRGKLRIQQRSDEVVVQKSWIDFLQSFAAGGYTWNSTQRSSANSKIQITSATKQRCDQSLLFLQNRAGQGHFSLDDFWQIQASWQNQKWPKLESFDAATAKLQAPLVPAAVVLKERWQIPFESFAGQTFKLQLGRDSDLLGQDAPKRYELEIELKDVSSEDVSEAAELIGSFLQDEGLDAEDTTSAKTHDFFQRLETLYPSEQP